MRRSLRVSRSWGCLTLWGSSRMLRSGKRCLRRRRGRSLILVAIWLGISLCGLKARCFIAGSGTWNILVTGWRCFCSGRVSSLGHLLFSHFMGLCAVRSLEGWNSSFLRCCVRSIFSIRLKCPSESLVFSFPCCPGFRLRSDLGTWRLLAFDYSAVFSAGERTVLNHRFVRFDCLCKPFPELNQD